MMALSYDVKNGKDKLACLKKQAAETCIPKTWAGLIHFMAFSSVIHRRVFSVYPDASPAIRSLFHGLINPRQANMLNNDIFYIMFTRDSNLNSKPGSSFEPNHFCPLVPMVAVHPKMFSYNESDFPSLQETFNVHKVRKFELSKNSPKDDSVILAKEMDQVSLASTGQKVFCSNYNESDFPSLQKTSNVHKVRGFQSSPSISKHAKVPFDKPYPLLPERWYERVGMLAAENKLASNKRSYPFCFEEEEDEEFDSTIKSLEHSQTYHDKHQPSYLVSERPFPHLPRQWYEKIGITTEHGKDENMTGTVENQLTSSKPHIFSGHKTVEGYLNYNQESYSINKRYFPLLSTTWFEKVGNTAMHGKKTNECGNSCPTEFPIKTAGLYDPLTQIADNQKPFPLLKKEWYKRRGKLATKNIVREKENIHKTQTLTGNNRTSISGVDYCFCSGTLRENLTNVRAILALTSHKTKKADLNGIIRTVEFIESNGPIVATTEAAKIFYAEKMKYLDKYDDDKKARIKSSEFYQKISHYLNVKQVYMFGKAFIMENRGQNVNDLINRFTNMINTEKVVNDKILKEIGDIFKQSLSYVDTKRDRDVLKALFSQATSASFVAKLQGVSNKTSIMNARDELKENINRYSDITKTSRVVRNDMTNEQQSRLTKRIIEKRKQSEIKLPEQYDNRGRMLKHEQFPEMSRIIEGIFEAGSMDETSGGGLESHPRLITSTRYRSIDNALFMHQARRILLSCAPPNFTISLSSCYNYTENYRENSSQAKRHHAGRNINANISLRRPPRDAVVDNKQVVNLHWSTCNVNYIVDTATNDKSFMIDSKDAKRIVLADCCPVQKPGKTWKKINLPDHDWDQSKTNAITPMSHLFLETNVTHKESVPLLLTQEDFFIHSSQRESITLHVTRTGKAVTLLNVSYYEAETTNRAFNEIFLLLTKPSLDSYFRNPDTGKLKESFVFVVDNGPSESPSSPLVQMWLSRLLKYLKLDRVSQISFAEYHSKRNFVERVHSAENEALSRSVFRSNAVHEKAEAGSKEHKENMENMAREVKECIEQAKFNQRYLEVHRGVCNNLVFDDDHELKRFLDLSEEEKQECHVYYEARENCITETLSEVWGIDAQFKGTYKEDYLRINNVLGTQRTAWCDKYQTTLWRQDNNWSGPNCSRTVVQPLPDYIRWLKTNELHYLTIERNSRIASTLDGRFQIMPGLFLPSRLLDLLYKINPNPTEDMFIDIALLVWIETDEVKRYFKERNEEDLRMFRHDKLRDQWKTTELYRKNSCQELQEKCKRAGLSSAGLKHQLVERLYANTTEYTPPSIFRSDYEGNIEDLPNSLKGLHNLSTAQMKYILQYHGLLIRGNRDELILRLSLLKNGQYRYAFYQEQNEIVRTIKDGETLILAERMDYLSHPDDIYRKRTYSSADQTKSSCSIPGLYTLQNLHELFKKLKDYLSIVKKLNSEKGEQLKMNTTNNVKAGSMEVDEEHIFVVGTKVKVKWSGKDLLGSGWKAGWYVAYVKSSDPLKDQIVVEHVIEPGCFYTLDVSPMIAEGSLKLA